MKIVNVSAQKRKEKEEVEAANHLRQDVALSFFQFLIEQLTSGEPNDVFVVSPENRDYHEFAVRWNPHKPAILVSDAGILQGESGPTLSMELDGRVIRMDVSDGGIVRYVEGVICGSNGGFTLGEMSLFNDFTHAAEELYAEQLWAAQL